MCIDERVAGFRSVSSMEGDIVYMAVRVGTTSLCGARGILGEPTNQRPWKDRTFYPVCWILENVEYCDPFEIKILAAVGGMHWAAKYLQASKAIKEKEAISLLEEAFQTRRRASLTRFPE